MSDGTILIYGAYGYTGDLIARLARTRGLECILAGRDAARLEPLGRELGMPTRTVGLDDPAALDAALRGVNVVAHCAGPFSRTSAPMVDACLRTGVHYLDITGEIAVFEALRRRDAEARDRGVMLLPGAGFDVVPTDCLAAHLHRRLPDATWLRMAFLGVGGGVSHGTAVTMLESMAQKSAVRRDGVLVEVPFGALRREIDFGRGPHPAVAIPWGDLSTAHHSTGIPNIEFYVGVPRAAAAGARLFGRLAPLTGMAWFQRMARRRLDAALTGPSAEQRARSFSLVWGEASNADGEVVGSRLRTREGYDFTADACLTIAERVLGGEAQPGFQTASTAFGPDFVLAIDGSSREDLPPPRGARDAG